MMSEIRDDNTGSTVQPRPAVEVPVADLEARQAIAEAQQLGLPPPKFSALNPRFLAVFASISALMFLAGLDSSVLSTALPLISNEYNNTNLYAWVINSYLIASTLMIPISAQLSELMGRKNLLLLSVSIFLFGSILSGCSTSMAMLVAFRAVQGLGAGPISSVGGIITSDIVPPRYSGKFNGVLGIVTALSVVGGPVFGGLITDQDTWRLIFWINLPIGVPAIAVIVWLLNYEKEREQRIRELEELQKVKVVSIHEKTDTASVRPAAASPRDENLYAQVEEDTVIAPRTKTTVLRSIDYSGMVLLLASILLALLASSFGSARSFAWTSSQVLGMFFGGLASFVLFLLNEAFVAKEPIMLLRQFTDHYVTFIYIIKFSIHFILMGTVSYIPVYFQIIRDDTPTSSGVKMLPLMFGFMLTSTVCGFIISKLGVGYPFLVVGMVLTTLATGLLTIISTGMPYAALLVFLAMLGLGLGFVTQVITVMLLARVPIRQVPMTVVQDNFARTAGGIVGVQVFQLIIQNYLDAKLSGKINLNLQDLSRSAISKLSAPDQAVVYDTYSMAMRIFYITSIPIAAISLLLALTLFRVGMPTRDQKISRTAAANL